MILRLCKRVQYDKQISFIAKSCISASIVENMFAALEDSPFSLSIDGGSDKFGKAYLAVSVRYFQHLKAVQPVTRLFGLLELNESSTGETFYEKITQLIFTGPSQNKLRRNFMGICADHGSNMISSRDAGVCNRLKQEFPYIFVTHDYCHVFNLVIKAGVSKFSGEITSNIANICSHFSRSSQRKALFRRIQAEMGAKEPLEVIKFNQIRWLSLRDCLDRILLLVDYLKSYFNNYGTSSEKLYLSSKNILIMKVLASLLNNFGFYIKFFEEDDLTGYYFIAKIIKESILLVRFDIGPT